MSTDLILAEPKDLWIQTIAAFELFGYIQPVRFIVNDRRLLTVGWFGERKILFQLIIHDRIRASEHAVVHGRQSGR